MVWNSFRKVWEENEKEIYVLSAPPELPTITVIQNKNGKKELYINGKYIYVPDDAKFSIYIRTYENTKWADVLLELERNIDDITIEIEELVFKWRSWADWIDGGEKIIFQRQNIKFECICSCHNDTIFYTNAYMNPRGCTECCKNHL